jgi:hypothetical protein
VSVIRRNVTFNEIKARISINLGDTAEVYFKPSDLDDAVNDAYLDTVINTQCIIRTTTVNFVANKIYYDFPALGVDDFLAVTAIYNLNNSRYLQDDVTLRDFDSFRDDWELWYGTPEFWAPSAWNKTAIIPHYADLPASGFRLHYWATPPAVNNDDTPLFPAQFHKLVEFHATAELLEQAEELMKAGIFGAQYMDGIAQMKGKTKNLARSDLLRRG